MKIILLSLIFLLSFAPKVFACEPCAKILNFEETVKEADLIVVGQKRRDGISSLTGVAEWVSVDINQILKGKSAERQIKVNSWDGMCDYGIVVDEGLYIMFLMEHQDEYNMHEYNAVNYGCSLKVLKVDAGSVALNGKKMTLIELKEKIEKLD